MPIFVGIRPLDHRGLGVARGLWAERVLGKLLGRARKVPSSVDSKPRDLNSISRLGWRFRRIWDRFGRVLFLHRLLADLLRSSPRSGALITLQHPLLKFLWIDRVQQVRMLHCLVNLRYSQGHFEFFALRECGGACPLVKTSIPCQRGVSTPLAYKYNSNVTFAGTHGSVTNTAFRGISQGPHATAA